MNNNWNHLVQWLYKTYPAVLDHYEAVLAGEEE